jgi:TetR/AcrR family transcriptional regulator, cholesterol catabolism regulator
MIAPALPPDRRAHITQVAMQMFSDNGIATTSMAEIAAAVGIKKASLYYFCASKEDLVYEAVAPAVRLPYEELRKIVASDRSPADKLVAAARSLGECFDRFPQSMACLVRERLERHLTAEAYDEVMRYKRRYTNLWKRIVAEGTNERQFRESDQKAVVFALLGSLNWMYAWHDPKGPVSAADFAGDWVALVLSGLER